MTVRGFGFFCSLAVSLAWCGEIPGGVVFEEWAPEYVARVDGGTVRLNSRGIEYRFSNEAVQMRAPGGSVWRWEMEQPLAARMHIFRASGTSEGRLGRRLRARDIYPGVDAVARGGGQGFEYDFVVRPGADPQRIALHFDGARRMRLHAGEMEVESAGGTLRFHPPVAYQEIDGARRPVKAAFRLSGNTVGFTTGNYDRTRPLVIDPVVAWASRSPATLTGMMRVAVGRDGSIYAVGSGAVPVSGETGRFGTGTGTNAYFLLKLAPGGSEITYLDVVVAWYAEAPAALAVDGEGCAYVAGGTFSAAYPVTDGAYQTTAGDLRTGSLRDGYLTKFSADGSHLVYSTLLGGDRDDTITGLVLDEQGNAYVTGATSSTLFPTTPGAWRDGYEPVFRESDYSYWGSSDAFLAQFNSTGTALLRSTVGLHVAGPMLARDPAGDLYVVGTPGIGLSSLVSSGERGYIGAMKFNRELSNRQWVLELAPGTYATTITAAAVDGAGCLLIGGYTNSAKFPTTDGAFQTVRKGTGYDGFLMKLKADGSGLEFSTLLGGTGNDWMLGLAVADAGAVHVVGATGSTDFPVTDDALQSQHGGGSSNYETSGDGFYARVASDGSRLETSTFLGGIGSSDRLNAVALDAAGAAYLAGRVSGVKAITLGGPAVWSDNVAALVKLTETEGSEPRITALTPGRTIAGSTGVSLQVSGEGFRPDAVVLIGSTRLAASVTSANQLEIQAPDELLTQVRTLDVRVVNPGVGVSNVAGWPVDGAEGTGLPYLRAIEPTGATAGQADVKVTLTGSGFTSGVTVNWKGVVRQPESSGDGTAVLSLGAEDLRETGNFPISVTTAAGASNELSFVVRGASAEMPAPVLPVTPAFDVAVRSEPAGKQITAYSPSWVALVDGNKREMTYAGAPAQRQITFQAEDNASVGMHELTVRDEVSGKTSNPIPYLVHLEQENRFLTFNPQRKLLYAVTYGRTGTEDLVVLDSQSMARLGGVLTGTQARPLLSTDGAYLYCKVSTLTGTFWRRFQTLGEDPWLQQATDFTGSLVLGVVPGYADRVLLGSHNGSNTVLELADQGVKKGSALVLPMATNSPSDIVFEDSSTAYVLLNTSSAYEKDVIRVKLGEQGVESAQTVANGLWLLESQTILKGHLFSRTGTVMDTSNFNTVARFPTATHGPVAVGDRIAYTRMPSSYYCLLTVVDPVTLRPEWSMWGGEDCSGSGDLVALDDGRLAWSSHSGKIYVAKRPSTFDYPNLEFTAQPNGSPITRIDLVQEANQRVDLHNYLWSGRQQVPLLTDVFQSTGPATDSMPIQASFTTGAPGNLELIAQAPSKPGRWEGELHLSVGNAVGPVKTIPMTLETLPIYPIQAEPATVEFQMKAGGTNPDAKTIHVAKEGASYHVNYLISYTPAVSWLSISYGQSDTTPIDFTLTVDRPGLTAGTYTANVKLYILDGPSITVPVTLRVE